MEEYYKRIEKESIEDLMRGSKSLYRNKFGKDFSEKDKKLNIYYFT